MENVAAMVPAILALMASPGPVTLASAALGAAYPWSVALPRVVAMTAGTMTVIALVATGVTGLVTALPGAAPILTALAGCYILYLAWKIATAPPVGERPGNAPLLLGAYLMAVANPKAFAAMGALFSGYPLYPGDPVQTAILKAGGLSLTALCINTTWMLSGSALRGLMSDPKVSRSINIAFSVALVASVAAMVLV